MARKTTPSLRTVLFKGWQQTALVLGVCGLVAGCASSGGADYCYGTSCLYPYQKGLEKVPGAQISEHDPRCSAADMKCVWLPGRDIKAWSGYVEKTPSGPQGQAPTFTLPSRAP